MNDSSRVSPGGKPFAIVPNPSRDAAVAAQTTPRAPANPVSVDSTTRLRVVGPASRISRRPASSSPRSSRLTTSIAQIAPMSVSWAPARQAVNPAAVSTCRGSPNSVRNPLLAPKSRASCARSAGLVEYVAV